MDLTGMRVEVQKTIAAPAEAVWDLLTDLGRVGEWSPECVHAEWSDGRGPRAGARFTGRNVVGEYEWSVECVVVAAERPRSFAWVVLDGRRDLERPSSRWRYDLEALADGTTRVTQRFAHGPGESGVTRWISRRPADAEKIVEGRREALRSNMLRTLAAMEAVAVASAAG
jgi:uncharacterized protein YndB with AHSA1/START domain